MQLIVKPLLSKAAFDVKSVQQTNRSDNSHIAQGSLDDGTRNSSVGSAPSPESTFTTPQVEAYSATDLSSGKASTPSMSLGSLASRFSALDFASKSRYF